MLGFLSSKPDVYFVGALIGTLASSTATPTGHLQCIPYLGREGHAY